MLLQQGVPTRVCQSAPVGTFARVAALLAALEGSESVFVVEQNHSRQLYHYLRGQCDFTQALYSYAVAGPVPLNSQLIAAQVLEELQS